MLAKPGLDQGIKFRDLLIEGHHPLRETGHHGGSQFLAGQGRVLGLGRLHGLHGEGGGATDLAVLQPGLDPLGAGAADGGRGLVARQQRHWPLLGQFQDAFQRREDLQELGAQAVDLAGAVKDHVQASGGQGPQVDSDIVAGPQQAQIAPDAGLVSDDEGVLRIGLSLTPVGGRGPVNREAGQIGDWLAVGDQKADQQSGTAVVEVDGPQHVAGHRQHIPDELEQFGFVVVDPTGQGRSPFALITTQ